MIFILIQDTLYVAGRLTANENGTLRFQQPITWWFLIFVKSTGGSVAVYVVDSYSFNTYYYV